MKADALNEPLIEIDDKADSITEVDDGDCRVVEPEEEVVSGFVRSQTHG